MRFVRFFIIAGIMSFATLGGATSVFAAGECKIAPLRPHEAGRVKSPRRVCKVQTVTVAGKPVVIAVRLPGRLR